MTYAPSSVLDNFFHCRQVYFQLFLMNFDEMKFLHLYYFGPVTSSFILALYSRSFNFCTLMSVLNVLYFLTLIWGGFEVPIPLPMCVIFKLFYLLVLTCDITVVRILFLDVYKTFSPCFFIYKANTISILFFENSTSVQSILTWKLIIRSITWASSTNWSSEK